MSLFSARLERRLLQFLLLVLDFVFLYFAFVVTHVLRFSYNEIEVYLKIYSNHYFWLIAFIFIACNYVFNLYEPRHWLSKLFSPMRISLAALSSVFIIFTIIYILATGGQGLIGRGILIGSVFIYLILSMLTRYIIETQQRKRFERDRWLIICPEPQLNIFLKDFKESGLKASFKWLDVGTVDNRITELEADLKQLWSGIIVDGRFNETATRLLMHARLRGHAVYSLQNFYETIWHKIPVFSLDSSWFAFSQGFSIVQNRLSTKLKRLSDILISLPFLIIISPIMLLLILLIKLESRGAAVYKQIRVGINGETFTIYKFRSMSHNAEAAGPVWAQKNDARVTRLGKIMRKTRLDELPQLINILNGDMSFIGPRPERPEFTKDLSAKIPFYELRHLVKPGLTGWAQVMYPYGASEEDAIQKLQYELFYIKNYSFELDMTILARTVSVIIFGKGR